MDIENKARDILLLLITEETGGQLSHQEVEVAVDRVLAKLWMKGYKIVPLSAEDEHNIDRDQA